MDGRKIKPRSAHSALNTLLQGAGAQCLKTWTITAYDMLARKGIYKGKDKDYYFVASVHDEIQLICKEEHAELIQRVMVEAAKAAGESLGMKCVMDAESKIGQNWYDCH